MLRQPDVFELLAILKCVARLLGYVWLVVLVYCMVRALF